MHSCLVLSVAGIVAAVFLALPARAEAPLEAPTGPVILSVVGDLARSNSENRADFDLEMLQAFSSTSIVTSTPWTEGVITFTGISLGELVRFLGTEAGTLRSVALYDYAVDIPVRDVERGSPIIAYARDGALMSIRDKGPLWVIYPFDEAREFRNEEIQARSIWQLRTIEVLP